MWRWMMITTNLERFGRPVDWWRPAFLLLSVGIFLTNVGIKEICLLSLPAEQPTLLRFKLPTAHQPQDRSKRSHHLVCSRSSKSFPSGFELQTIFLGKESIWGSGSDRNERANLDSFLPCFRRLPPGPTDRRLSPDQLLNRRTRRWSLWQCDLLLFLFKVRWDKKEQPPGRASSATGERKRKDFSELLDSQHRKPPGMEGPPITGAGTQL